MLTNIDSQLMRDRAKELRDRHKDLLDALQAADRTVKQVAAETEGRGTEAYCERWMQEQRAIENSCNCVEEFAQAADKIAQIMDETQDSIANALKM